MGSPYRQFCPVAKAMELLDERWTLLVVRELVAGSEHFNDLRRGLPRMSPGLLSKRLQQLARAGLVERRSENGEIRYLLTEAGRELGPVVEAVGAWGVRWARIADEDLDPRLLMWDMHRNVDRAAVPDGRTVVRFRFDDVPRPTREWWLVIGPDEVDVCDVDPGHPVAATVQAPLRSLTEVWMGDRTWVEVLRTGELRVQAPEDVRRTLPAWFTLSSFAAVPRVPPVATHTPVM
jgi:DNA-binding HxlR family transcriptional regulator